MPVVSHVRAGVGVCVQGEAVTPGPSHLHPLQLGLVSAHRAQRVPHLTMTSWCNLSSDIFRIRISILILLTVY